MLLQRAMALRGPQAIRLFCGAQTGNASAGGANQASRGLPNGKPSMWDLIAGRVKTVHVDVKLRDIPEAMRHGDYENDRAFRVEFQRWMNDIWQEKQARIQQLSA